MKAYFTFSLLLISLVAQGQDGSLKVRVIDNLSGLPLADVRLVLMSNSDTGIRHFGQTDSLGFYEFLGVDESRWSLNCIKERYISRKFTIQSPQDSMLIALMPDISEFKGASVKGKPQFIVQEIDKTVVYPEGLVTSTGLNALDLLERSPGVLVDQLGGIQLQGVAGVSIYLNNQLLSLAGDELNQYLRTIPAENIQTISIITNPSSKYPAAGNGGVIVIRLKKSVTKGFNGRYGTSVGSGKLLRHGQNLNLNYRINKVNFFGNGSFAWNNNYQDLTIRRTYYEPGGALSSTFVQNTWIAMMNRQFQGNVGADFYLRENKTLGFSLTGFDLFADRHTTSNAEIRDSENVLRNKVEADIPLATRFKNLGGNFYYDIALDSGNSKVSIYSDLTNYKSRNRQSTRNRLLDSIQRPINETMLEGDLPASIWISSSGVDYSVEKNKLGRAEAGVRLSFIDADNYAGFYDVNNGVRTINNIYSNDFDYRENIHAAYVNQTAQWRGLSAQMGLRYEYTMSEGVQSGNDLGGNDSSFKREYHSLFPSLFLSYTLDSLSRHVIGFNYSRRVNRPNYSDMNPFIYPLDRYTLYAGNPFIRPTFSNEMELSYFYRSKWRMNAVYGMTDNLISETIEQVDGIFYSRPGNIGKQFNYSLNINGSSSIGKWLRLSVYAELTHNVFKGQLYGQTLSNVGTYWVVMPNLQFQIHKKLSAELSGSYQSDVVSAQFVMIPVGTARAGFSWQINANGQLRLSVSDMFYTMKPGGQILSLNNSEASWKSQLDTRVATLSFSYKFNKGKSMNRYRNEEMGSEKQRVRVG